MNGSLAYTDLDSLKQFIIACDLDVEHAVHSALVHYVTTGPEVGGSSFSVSFHLFHLKIEWVTPMVDQ